MIVSSNDHDKNNDYDTKLLIYHNDDSDEGDIYDKMMIMKIMTGMDEDNDKDDR